MAIIPVGQKFHTLTSSTVTSDLGSARANSGREVYTMQDIINTVSATGGSIDGSGVQYALPVFTDTNTITNLAIGTAGQVLTSNGAGANPSFQTLSLSAYVPFVDGTDRLVRAETFNFGAGVFGNTSLGFQALQNVPSGDVQNNVVIGYEAGKSLTNAEKNVIIGSKAADAMTLGDFNVIIGYEAAGFSNFTGQKNVLVGRNAGFAMSSGESNVAIGDRALENESTKNGSVAVGHNALGLQVGTSNPFNVAVGFDTGKKISSGIHNTLLGGKAGATGTNDLTTGSNNTIIGYSAAATSASVSNEITLGNSSVGVLRCAVTSITALSDERDKTEIVDLDTGLDTVMALKPRKFVWNNRAEIRTEKDEDGNLVEVEYFSANKGKKDFGFIAQEVKELDSDTLRLVYDENPDKLEMSYGKLVPILVKAIQELKEQLDNKQDK